jgi:hypothetical protein
MFRISIGVNCGCRGLRGFVPTKHENILARKSDERIVRLRVASAGNRGERKTAKACDAAKYVNLIVYLVLKYNYEQNDCLLVILILILGPGVRAGVCVFLVVVVVVRG